MTKRPFLWIAWTGCVLNMLVFAIVTFATLPSADASVRNPGDLCEGGPTEKATERCQARRDSLSRYHGKLRVWAVYHPKTNKTTCDLTDRRIKKRYSGSELRHSHWRMSGKHSAKDCLEAFLQQ
jgi:hypothetical protein